jgi:hypothetical protein
MICSYPSWISLQWIQFFVHIYDIFMLCNFTSLKVIKYIYLHSTVITILHISTGCQPVLKKKKKKTAQDMHDTIFTVKSHRKFCQLLNPFLSSYTYIPIHTYECGYVTWPQCIILINTSLRFWKLTPYHSKFWHCNKVIGYCGHSHNILQYLHQQFCIMNMDNTQCIKI